MLAAASYGATYTREDTGPNTCAHAKGGQLDRAEHTFELLARLDRFTQELVQGLAAEKGHWAEYSVFRIQCSVLQLFFAGNKSETVPN
jgi:hypothetical protein